MKRYLICFCLFIGACTNLSQMPLEIPNTNIKNFTYAQIIKNREAGNNTPIRLGGLIIEVENKENYSLVQVLFFPLNHRGEPQLDRDGGGRFVIKSPDFFDPIIYNRNRKITTKGILKGEIERTVGERIIKVPLIESSAIHLWPNEKIYNHNGHYYSEDHHDDYDHGD